jgi:carbamoylphosphate synthase small subunit
MASDPGSPKAILLLQDGTYFEGKAAGKPGTATGEICFNTGMTGYQEIFTDPSYYGQILVTTHVHIGNYGTKRKRWKATTCRSMPWFARLSLTNLAAPWQTNPSRLILKNRTGFAFWH